MNRKTALAGIALLVFASLVPPGRAAAATAPAADDDALAAKIDAVMAEVYKPGQPGAAVIVRKNGRTLYRKGYGLADLELGVPVAPGMVFRLGSITKQFTAVSILLLAQEGRLGLLLRPHRTDHPPPRPRLPGR